MAVFDDDVASRHWEGWAAASAARGYVDHVSAFAREHGLVAGCVGDLQAALVEVLADAVRSSAEPGRVAIDAAADQDWLAVRMEYDRDQRTPAPRLTLSDAVADRLEASHDDRSSRFRVLLEFPLGPHASDAAFIDANLESEVEGHR